MTNGPSRPRPSNSPQALRRLIGAMRNVYWSNAALRKLLWKVLIPRREEYFRRGPEALTKWPERSREENLEASSRVQPRRLLNGRHAWPGIQAALQEYADNAPPDYEVDYEALREVLGQLPPTARKKFLKMLREAMEGLIKLERSPRWHPGWWWAVPKNNLPH